MAAWIAAVASVELSSRAPNALTLKILSVFFESTLKFPAFHVAVSGTLPSALTRPAVLTAPPFAAMSARTSLAVIPSRESAWKVSYSAGPRRARAGKLGNGIMVAPPHGIRFRSWYAFGNYRVRMPVRYYRCCPYPHGKAELGDPW